MKLVLASAVVLVLLAAGCGSGGAVDEGTVTDLVSTPTTPQPLPPLRHDGEIVIASAWACS